MVESITHSFSDILVDSRCSKGVIHAPEYYIIIEVWFPFSCVGGSGHLGGGNGGGWLRSLGFLWSFGFLFY